MKSAAACRSINCAFMFSPEIKISCLLKQSHVEAAPKTNGATEVAPPPKYPNCKKTKLPALVDHPSPRHLGLHRDALVHRQCLKALVQCGGIQALVALNPILPQQCRNQRRKRLSRHPRCLGSQIFVRLLEFRQFLLPCALLMDLLATALVPFFHRGHDAVDLRIQCLLLRIQFVQNLVQNNGGIRQPLRCLHHLLCHFFIHVFSFKIICRGPPSLRIRFSQFDPGLLIRCLLPPQHCRACERHFCEHPYVSPSIRYLDLRYLVRHSQCAGCRSFRTRVFDLPHQFRKVFRKQVTAEFQVLPHDFRSRDYPNFHACVMPVKRRRVVQCHSHQGWKRLFRGSPGQHHSMSTRSGWRPVRHHIHQRQYAAECFSVRMSFHLGHRNRHRIQFHVDRCHPRLAPPRLRCALSLCLYGTRQRAQSAHPPHFLDTHHAVAQQDFLDLRLFHFVH